jgi:hypothetical protein
VVAAAAAGVLLGLAAGVKPIVLPLALPLVWALRREPAAWRGGLIAAGACGATLLALYLPFALREGGLDGMLETSRRFVSAWRFNGSVHPLIDAAVRPWLDGEPWDVADRAKQIADAVCGGLLLAVLLVSTFVHRDVWRTAAVFLFAAVCLSSTAHPWYLLWALALLPIAWPRGSRAAGWAIWTASLTLPWSYVAWLSYAEGGEYQAGLWVGVAVWGLVYGALGVGWRGGRAGAEATAWRDG